MQEASGPGSVPTDGSSVELKHPFFVFVEGIVYFKNRFLMIRRAWNESYLPGKIAFPAGKVERETLGNALEQAVTREILEETGVTVKAPRYLSSESFLSSDGRWAISVQFLCEYSSGIPTPQPEEVFEVMWMTSSEVYFHPDTPEWIKRTLENAEKMLAG